MVRCPRLLDSRLDPRPALVTIHRAKRPRRLVVVAVVLRAKRDRSVIVRALTEPSAAGVVGFHRSHTPAVVWSAAQAVTANVVDVFR